MNVSIDAHKRATVAFYSFYVFYIQIFRMAEKNCCWKQTSVYIVHFDSSFPVFGIRQGKKYDKLELNGENYVVAFIFRFSRKRCAIKCLICLYMLVCRVCVSWGVFRMLIWINESIWKKEHKRTQRITEYWIYSSVLNEMPYKRHLSTKMRTLIKIWYCRECGLSDPPPFSSREW